MHFEKIMKNRLIAYNVIVIISCVVVVNSIPQLNYKKKPDKLFYNSDKTINRQNGVYLDSDGSPVEDTLRTLLAIRHHSLQKEPLATNQKSKTYKKFLDQLPRGISPVMRHISKLVPDEVMSLQAEGNRRRIRTWPEKRLVDDEEVEGQIDYNDSNGRDRAPTDPKYEDTVNNEKLLQTGFNILSDDWSEESKHWIFLGGEWSIMDLPDPDHPNLPPSEVPGPSLVAVSGDYLKKLYLRRDVPKLTNIMFHFRYFLSDSLLPPTLQVFLTTEDDYTSAIDIQRVYGVWGHNTLHIDQEGPFQISFVATLWDIGNEIALDDITIKGFYDGGENQIPEDKIIESENKDNIENEYKELNTDEPNIKPINDTGDELNNSTSLDDGISSPSVDDGVPVINEDLENDVNSNNSSSTGGSVITDNIDGHKTDEPNNNLTNETSENSDNTLPQSEIINGIDNKEISTSEEVSTTQGANSVLINHIEGEENDDESSTGGSWSVFNVFLLLGLCGACIIGALYYRKKRRLYEEEIAVFNRNSYTDFHNPTFSDDNNEVNNTTRSLKPSDNNAASYKSFH